MVDGVPCGYFIGQLSTHFVVSTLKYGIIVIEYLLSNFYFDIYFFYILNFVFWRLKQPNGNTWYVIFHTVNCILGFIIKSDASIHTNLYTNKNIVILYIYWRYTFKFIFIQHQYSIYFIFSNTFLFFILFFYLFAITCSIHAIYFIILLYIFFVN